MGVPCKAEAAVLELLAVEQPASDVGHTEDKFAADIGHTVGTAADTDRIQEIVDNIVGTAVAAVGATAQVLEPGLRQADR